MEMCYSTDENDTILNLKGLPMLNLKRTTLITFVGDSLTTVQVLKNNQILTASSHLNFGVFSIIKVLNGCPMIITTYDSEREEMDIFSESLEGGYEDLF